MASLLISINEAAELSGRSPQTIRRLIKSKKVKFKKSKTPQGFNYEIDKLSLVECYNIQSNVEAVVEQESSSEVSEKKEVKAPVEKATKKKEESKQIKDLLDSRSHKVLVDYAPVKEFNNTLQVLLKQHAKEKENLFKLVEAFQNKVVTLETKIKTTEANSGRWYKFW